MFDRVLFLAALCRATGKKAVHRPSYSHSKSATFMSGFDMNVAILVVLVEIKNKSSVGLGDLSVVKTSFLWDKPTYGLFGSL